MRVWRVAIAVVLGALATWASAWLGVLATTTQPPWADQGMVYETWVGEYGRIPTQRRPTPLGDVFLSWSGWALHETVMVGPSWGGGVPDPIPQDWLEIYPLVKDLHPEYLKHYARVDRALPSWTVYPDAETSLRALATHAAGWPWAALTATEEHFPWAKPPNRAVRGAIVFSGWQGNPGVWLPVRPLWHGLVLDSVFYAVVVLAVWSGLGRGRAWLRTRRSRCAKCGYDRRGIRAEAACPECGEAPAAAGDA